MATEVKTEITINATPEKVWSVLTHFEQYPAWNPFIKSIRGDVQVGNKISVRIEPAQSKGMNFTPKVLAFERNKEFRWLGHLFIPGIFDGEHKFELIDHGNGTTTLKHSETFGGILKGILNLENTRKDFEAMNGKLKELAEQ